DSRIFVAGHRGLVGSAIVRALRERGYSNLILRSRSEVDLRDAGAVDRFFAEGEVDYVFLAAATVGGVLANATSPVDFLHDNLAIEMNVIQACHRYGVKKVQMLGSSCIYPKFAPQPIKEEYLLSGPLEPTNEWYAVAKIAGIKLAQAYRKQYGLSAISLMPTNVYGPGDNFDLLSSHVLPALVRKFHEAKTAGASEIVVWGTGTPRREFLHVDNLAEACILLMDIYDDSEIINVGTQEDLTISELAEIISSVVGFRGTIRYDASKPDGTPRKLLDISKIRSLGWAPTIALRDGIEQTYRWYLENSAGTNGNQ
ncbi:MAG TPA: GDP-L-fucose synthase, partial [Bryobacteraceae bacterium]|nr:GDP-L-fucose synthase [Bryobacteraceae bacterium]